MTIPATACPDAERVEVAPEAAEDESQLIITGSIAPSRRSWRSGGGTTRELTINLHSDALFSLLGL